MAFKDFEFKSEGKGIRHDQRPICAKFPAHIDQILRAMPDRSEYVRKAVERQLREDGLL